MLPEQMTFNTILMAKPNKIIVHPGFFTVADKYTRYVKIGEHHMVESKTVVGEGRIIDLEVSFSEDADKWTEKCYRPVTWLIENYMLIPYEPVYRNRLEEVG